MAESLLYIPDITGFTRFVNETEADHSRHIVAEILEVLIASDDLGMTVSEIEGDAILFFLPGKVPDTATILDQARRTYQAFHAHLKRYEAHRICECGACRSAPRLTLKIVAHAGPMETIRVREFVKPYGTDVILAHRLLKNDVPEDEYVLLTQRLLPEEALRSALPTWARISEAEAHDADLGTVRYGYAPLGELRSEIPEPEPPVIPAKIRNPVRKTAELSLPPDAAFELISNFDYRLSWNDGVDELDYVPDRVNRVGTRHECVIGGNLIEFATVTNEFGEGRRVYGERLLSDVPVEDPVIYYIVEPSGSGSRVVAEVHFRAKSGLGVLQAVVFRVAIGRSIGKALRALKRVAVGFRVEGVGAGREGGGSASSA